MESIGLKLAEQRGVESEHQIPFRSLELPFDFSGLSIKDLEDIQQEIFKSWFQHQETPVLDAVGAMRIEDPQDSHDSLIIEV